VVNMSKRNKPKSPKAANYTIDLTDVPSLPDRLADRMGDNRYLTRAEREEADRIIANATKVIREKRYGLAVVNGLISGEPGD
jgi:hypothetical protein